MRMVAWLIGGAAGIAALGAAAWIGSAWVIERPAHRILASEGDFEVRAYPSMAVAEIETEGDRQAAVRAGFSPLARYIFARDREGDSIAMTAPVTQQRREDGAWTVRFILPAAVTAETAPAPAGAVRVAEAAPARYAAVRFSGAWSDANFANAEARLRAWLAARGAVAEGPPIYAYYNDPFTPPFLRRNEVLLALAGD